LPKLDLIGRASRLGTMKLVSGGAGRIWILITLASWVLRLVRWLANRNNDVYRQELKPGQKLVIEHSRDSLGNRPRHEPT